VDHWGTDERELVRRCRDGSEAAYAELVRLHRPRLYNLAFRLVADRETAEDVVQETFLAAFKAIDRFEPKPSLAPWLNTIAVRIAKRAAERGRARPKASLDLIGAAGDSPLALIQPIELDPAAHPEAAAEAAELRREVDAVIEALPFNYRSAVVLRFVMGLDYAAAAQTMNVPLNTYKSHLLRGTKLLRAGLARQLEPPAAPIVEVAGNGHGAGLDVEIVRAQAAVGRSAGKRLARQLEPPSAPIVEVAGTGHGAGRDADMVRAQAGVGRPAVGRSAGSPTGPVELEGAAIPRRASSVKS
jgi:RNA polymerase sigma-70 factor (ECF subfamily)